MPELSTRLFSGTDDGEAYAAQVDAILAENTLCTLATINGDGSPHVNTAYYAYDDQLRLYILTPPTTVHAENLTFNPAVALTIFRSDQVWNSPHRGLQLFARAEAVSEEDHPRVFECYAAAHDRVLELVPSAQKMLVELESRFYSFEVESLKLVDEAANGAESLVPIDVRR